MLSWLKSFWDNVTGTVGEAIAATVHWAMHALASVVFAVFRLVGISWHAFYDACNWLGRGLNAFGLEVWHFGNYVVRDLIPSVIRWAWREIGKLYQLAIRIYRDLLRWVDFLFKYINRVWHDITSWVIRDIWDPLKRFADLIWTDLRKWGYTAWWWITHLPNLAEALIFHIALSLEKHAWQLAGMLGKFGLSLVRRNLRKFLLLAEDILSAVL